MSSNISEQVARLRSLSRQELLGLWQTLYRRAAPACMRREIMVPFLAYRIQENAYGSPKPATRSKLRRLARSLEQPGGSTEKLLRPKLKNGSRIFREWRGETHEVVVTKSGFEYRRASYRSLSEIARKITGTRWSGPAFFGLNTAKPVSGRPDG